MKTCRFCKETKPYSEFNISRVNADGYDTRCKTCKSKEARERRLSNYFHSYILTKRAECNKKGFDFNLTEEYLESIWTGVCPIFNIPISYGNKGCGSHNSAHLDRLNPDKGYIIGNVAWISGRANRIKYNATSSELRKIADWMERAETI